MEDGRECQPCPEHGTCIDGHLQCDPGYRLVNSRCPEDQEVSLYAEHLANQAQSILRELAGRAECGEKVTDTLSYSELREALMPISPEGDVVAGHAVPSNRRRRSIRYRERFDEAKFSPAFTKAMALLHGSDSYGVLHMSGGYRAKDALLPLSCMVRRAAFHNWRAISVFIVSVLAWAYLSIKRRIQKTKQKRIADVCDQARASLLEQSSAYRDGDAANSFIIDTQLRDEIVGHSRQAIQLWKEVEKQLARDTRVQKTGPVTVDGHPCYYWEWRGRASLGGGSAIGRSSFGSSVGSTGRQRQSPGVSDGRGGMSVSPSALPTEHSAAGGIRSYGGAARFLWRGYGGSRS